MIANCGLVKKLNMVLVSMDLQMRSYFVARRSISGRKERNMNKFILSDNTEIEIKGGASLGAIVAIVPDFTVLGTLADALTKPGNLDSVQFTTGDAITGEYTDMKLESPLFKAVDVVDGKVLATFGIREKTETEKRLDALESGQEIQDGAIGDLGEVVSTIAEGGNA